MCKNKPGHKLHALPISLSLLAGFGMLVMCVSPSGKGKQEITISDGRKILPYRSLFTEDSILIGYVLYKRKTTETVANEFSAITNTVDPTVRNYKSCCKAIIKDITGPLKNKSTIIYIYDDAEAFNMYEINYLEKRLTLDKKQTNFLRKHLVAIYQGEIGDHEWSNMIRFYPESNNLAESEPYAMETNP